MIDSTGISLIGVLFSCHRNWIVLHRCRNELLMHTHTHTFIEKDGIDTLALSYVCAQTHSHTHTHARVFRCCFIFIKYMYARHGHTLKMMDRPCWKRGKEEKRKTETQTIQIFRGVVGASIQFGAQHQRIKKFMQNWICLFSNCERLDLGCDGDDAGNASSLIVLHFFSTLNLKSLETRKFSTIK